MRAVRVRGVFDPDARAARRLLRATESDVLDRKDLPARRRIRRLRLDDGEFPILQLLLRAAEPRRPEGTGGKRSRGRRGGGSRAGAMKIGLYIEHGDGNGVGGAELSMAYLASAWARTHDVDFIHHRRPLTRERLQSFTDDDLSRVAFRYMQREPEPQRSDIPWERYGAARDWQRALSTGYDLFVTCTHWLPTFCHARSGALPVLFPFYLREVDTSGIRALPLWKRIRHAAYYEFEWRRRMATYRHRLAISDYARSWTRRRWGIDCGVVYPPVDTTFDSVAKKPLILSIGRFSTMAHTKKQLEQMEAFRAIEGAASGWTYASVGGLNKRPENHAFFERVRHAACGSSATVEANLSRASIRSLLERARIFWHATGLNENTDERPELAEHFGIATVEAMAAGCVPVVLDKGGQREIVTHGKTGFLWNTLDELRAYTLQLIDDPELCGRLSHAARLRAALFTRERFLQRLSAECGVRLPQPKAVHSAAAHAMESGAL